MVALTPAQDALGQGFQAVHQVLLLLPRPHGRIETICYGLLCAVVEKVTQNADICVFVCQHLAAEVLPLSMVALDGSNMEVTNEVQFYLRRRREFVDYQVKVVFHILSMV
jgi:hypothetical protein